MYLCFRQLGRRAPEDRRQPRPPRRRLCDRLWQQAISTRQVAATLQRDFRARGRGVLRRPPARRPIRSSLTAANKPGRHRLLPPRSACDRGRMRRAGIFHRRRAALSGRRRRSGASIRPSSNGRSAASLPEFVHAGRPMAVSITQATEVGTVYSLDEIEAISAIAARHGLPLHMDGARFANALVALDATPAEMTWKRGVDILSFGGTKNGCWCAEAVVLFDPGQAGEMRLHPQARRAALFQVALHRGAVRRLFRGRAVAGDRRATPMPWRPGWPATSRVEDVAAGLGAAGQRGLRHHAGSASASALHDEGRRVLSTGTRRTALPARSRRTRCLCRFVTSFATTRRRRRSLRRAARLSVARQHEKGGARRRRSVSSRSRAAT